MMPRSHRVALRLGIALLLVAGLLVPRARSRDGAFIRAAQTIEAQHVRSSRALDHAVQQLPDLSIERRAALLRCIDLHLACARRDLVAAVEARDRCDDDRLATLVELEVREYRETCERLRSLRGQIARA